MSKLSVFKRKQVSKTVLFTIFQHIFVKYTTCFNLNKESKYTVKFTFLWFFLLLYITSIYVLFFTTLVHLFGIMSQPNILQQFKRLKVLSKYILFALNLKKTQVNILILGSNRYKSMESYHVKTYFCWNYLRFEEMASGAVYVSV